MIFFGFRFCAFLPSACSGGFCFFIIRVWILFIDIYYLSSHFICADHQAEEEGEHSKKEGAGHEGEEGSGDEEPKVLEIKILMVFLISFFLLCPTIQQLVARQ